MTNLNKLDAIDMARRLARRDITAEALLRDCLERIAEREPAVQAFAHLAAEKALARARELDRGTVQGALHGLPIGVKDIFDTHDMPTQYGSRVYEGYQPGSDAACVAL